MKKYTHIPSNYVRSTWIYAGKKAGVKHAYQFASDKPIIPVILDNQPYSVSRGYYVPFYSIDANSPNTKRASVLDQKRRFFYYAEKGIDVANSYTDIMRDYDQWENSANGRVKEALGRLVVGSMVNRAARIEQAMVMGRAGGLGLEDNTSGNIDLTDEDRSSLKGELKIYANTLMKNHTLISSVRRNDYSIDRDGLLADIIRETFKAYAAPNESVVRGTIDKIGEAMEAIDETSDATRNVISSLENNRLLKNFMSSHAKELDTFFTKLTDTSRARVGIKSRDNHYSDMYMDFSIATEDCFNLIQHLRAEARKYDGKSSGSLLQGLKLVSDGAKLIEDMAQSRYPYNERAFPDIPRNKREATSVEYFKEEIQRFIAHKPSRSAAD